MGTAMVTIVQVRVCSDGMARTQLTSIFPAYFVRNHVSSPTAPPREPKTFSGRKSSGEIPPVTDSLARDRENFGAGLPTPAGDREAFYTPSETAPSMIPLQARVGSPAAGSTNGVNGPRTIAAGAFRRNKPTPAIASGPGSTSSSAVTGSTGSPSGSPRHSGQYGSAAAQQSYTPVQLPPNETTEHHFAGSHMQGASNDVQINDPGVDPSLGLGAALAPPAYGHSHHDAPVDDVYAADHTQQTPPGANGYDDDRQLR